MLWSSKWSENTPLKKNLSKKTLYHCLFTEKQDLTIGY